MSIGMAEKLDKDALKVLDILNRYCCTGWIVGGAVRDTILGKTPKDWDVCTNATPDYVTKIFNHHGYKVLPTGEMYGTVTIVVNDKQIECTTMRSDGFYTNGRKPDSIIFTDAIEVDLMRRDFTINAIAVNKTSLPARVEYLLNDPFNGIADIENKIIRCVGKPSDRFKEDGIRILRALRFAAQLGFTIEEETSKAIHECKHILDYVSKERIQSELCKILMSDFCGNKVLEEYADVFRYIIPELHERTEHTLGCMDSVCSENECDDIIVRLALYICNVEDPSDNSGSAKIANRVLKELKFSNETVAHVTQLVSYRWTVVYDDKITIKMLLNKIGYKQLKRLIMLNKLCVCSVSSDDDFDKNITRLLHAESLLDKIVEKNECYSLKQLAVNGDDIIAMGIPRGKQVKHILNILLSMVVTCAVKNKKKKLTRVVEALIESGLYFVE